MNRYTKISDFHGNRAKGVGSSDIPILAGLVRHYGSTSLSLWESKTGRVKPWGGNDKTRWGKKLEGLVLREFVARRYGKELADQFYRNFLHERSTGPFKVFTECRHPKYKFCLAHADLLVEDGHQALLLPDLPPELQVPDGQYIVEAKTSGFMAGKRREGQIFAGYDPDDRTAQGIPDGVYLQTEWQEFTYDVPVGFVAALIDTSDYREYGPIHADTRVQEKCLALAERFWRLVETDTPPAPETWDDVQRLFPHQTLTTAMVGGDDEMRVREMIKRDKELAARIKDLGDERDDIKNAIGVLLGENSVLAATDGSVLAKSSEQSRESVSLAKLKKESPELEKQLRDGGYISVSEFRVARY